MIYGYSQSREKENPFLHYLTEIESETDVDEGDAVFQEYDYTHTREFRLYKVFRSTGKHFRNKPSILTHHQSLHSRTRHLYYRTTSRGLQIYHTGEKVATYYYIKREVLPEVIQKFWPNASDENASKEYYNSG